MSSRSNLDGDITLAVAAIAAEFGVEVDHAPPSLTGILRSFSAAHYNAGARDTIARFAGSKRVNEPRPSSGDPTPITGPHGRRTRASVQPDTRPLSKRPTPIVPPPHGVLLKDDDRKR